VDFDFFKKKHKTLLILMLYALGGSETLVKRICFIMIHDLVMRCTKIFAGTQKKKLDAQNLHRHKRNNLDF